MKNFSTKFRANSHFAGITSKAIELTTRLQNANEDGLDIMTQTHTLVLEHLSFIQTDIIFEAAGKLIPLGSTESNMSQFPEGCSILDMLILSLGRIISADVLAFCGAANFLGEVGDATNPVYGLRAKTERKINTAIAVDDITDEMRDEMSGKGVVASPDGTDNDCVDGVCKL